MYWDNWPHSLFYWKPRNETPKLCARKQYTCKKIQGRVVGNKQLSCSVSQNWGLYTLGFYLLVCLSVLFFCPLITYTVIGYFALLGNDSQNKQVRQGTARTIYGQFLNASLSLCLGCMLTNPHDCFFFFFFSFF